MDESLRTSLIAFVKPLYLDLDGVSHFDEVDRVSTIARRLYQPSTPAEERTFELLLLFHGLGKWLARMGNRSRTILASNGNLSDNDIRSLIDSINRIEAPESDAERALATALMIESAGARGLAIRLAKARREGLATGDVARAELAESSLPRFPLEDRAVAWLELRQARRLRIAREILDEESLADEP